MTVIGGIGFLSPWLLISLLVLPILWLILRAIPPAPIRRRFPGVALLLGLTDDDTVTDRTPWWLLLLRMLAVAAIILGLAGPVLNPRTDGVNGSGPLLIIADASWAAAPTWTAQIDAMDAELARAGADNRSVGFVSLADPEPVVFQSAEVWRARLPGLIPSAWQPGPDQITQVEQILNGTEPGEILWFSDGISYEGQDQILAAAMDAAPTRVLEAGRNALAIHPARYADGLISLKATRAAAGEAREITILAQGRDPAGNAQLLSTVTATFEADAITAEADLNLPAELRARISRFEIGGARSAGATTLVDDSLRRREVALVAGRESREGLELLSPLHYLQRALAPSSDILLGPLSESLLANPDVIVLADVATLSDQEAEAITTWVENGGLLLRFAGPRVAASDVSRSDEDPLMPVRLRVGGRSVGGAMSWGAPKQLAPFAQESLFFGLDVPEDVLINAQVMAQPDPSLADRVIAELTDGTPLVTRKELGQGQVVLFHVTANAEWSSLPLSGLFVEMLERLTVFSSGGTPTAEDLEGTSWQAQTVLNGFGRLGDPGAMPGIDGPDLVTQPPGPRMPPGLYLSEDRSLAKNVISDDTVLQLAAWPSSVEVSGWSAAQERPIGGPLLAAALILLMADIVASLFLSGRLGTLGRATAAVALALGLAATQPPAASAQGLTDQDQISAAAEVVLAHVLTGNAGVDDIARAGLQGLSDTLYFRTSVEPATPVGVNLETDELSFYPILYWPVTADQPRPSAGAYAKLNEYMRSGGLILFDTRDADTAGLGTTSPANRRLQQLAAPLDIPALEPIPADHVLTRTFYLLQDFPGRYQGSDVWVEAAPPGAEQIEGMPFRNLNDGVTPVIIGGNDWAAAWAINGNGAPLLPVGRGFGGDRQRELAYRFGVNLIMHVLTGNYKSDQVHVPALLDRLGQ